MESDLSQDDELERRLLELERRLAALEQWKSEAAGSPGMQTVREAAAARADVSPVVERVAAAPGEPADGAVVQPPTVEFDLSMVGRTLIVLGGAFLLRSITESGLVSASVGVSLGLVYAAAWLVAGMRPAVSRTSAAYHGLAAVLAAYPLVFEATRKFAVLDAWSSALTLAVVSALWVVLCWRKMLNGLAWIATLGFMGTSVLLMAETTAMVPFVWLHVALGVTTLWMGYRLKWHLIRWPVAAFLDVLLLFMAFLVVTGRSAIPPTVAMAAGAGAFAAYLASFVLRNLVRERSVVAFEVSQTIVLGVCGLGGAMWIAGAKDTFEVPLALAILVIAAASYGASFVFIPRHSTGPANFFFYSTLALVLVLGAGMMIAEGLPSSALWSGLALTAGFFAGRYEKPVLALHCAIYLVAGLVSTGLLQAGVRTLAIEATGDWGVPWVGAALILVASGIAASIHPMARRGTYSVWRAAKLAILAVFTWTGATMLMAMLGTVLHGTTPSAAMVSFERTAVLSGLTIGAAFVARWPTLSPGRTLASVLMVSLAMKLLWDDLRVGTPLTMFLSFACVGVALILATKLRKSAALQRPA
jgi:hypothetical protein